jgi:uncharacterized cupin superfamily protein
MSRSATALPVLNWFEVEWQDWTEGPALYHTSVVRLSTRLGARKLGYHAEIFPPGKVLCPYHVHLVNEEGFLVMGGEMSVRLDGMEYTLRAGDLVAIPPGPDGAHQFLNRSDRPAHLFAASTKIPRDVVDYPESGKRLYAVDGLGAGEERASALLKEGRVAEYYEGEAVGELPERPHASGSARDPRIVNLDDVPWEPFGQAPFGGERKRVGRAVGARLVGYSLYRIQPGRQASPFHFHHVNEEFFYVRSGYGQLRTGDGVRDLRPGDAFACPPGPEGAHAILNSGDRALEYFAMSTMEQPDVVEYPDSGKLYVMIGSAPGGDPQDRSVDLVFRMSDAVDYLEGER